MESNSQVVLALTTFASDAAAVAFVRALLDKRVIACGTLVPGGRSLYRWDGQLTDEAETVVLFKTVRSRVADLKAEIAELHPYATPELLVFDASDGMPAYMAWVIEQTASGPE